ncbi:MAG: 2-succinyl-5-enolpyruvyl-6-hydroxy-3-cyclohexene-1-carboxylic-acid synthase [Rhodocyclales bacterium]|nr:2-succinyl-5-enolpyruvyl-6-hydroxy-3-cyclohexene-1-carboxylic-acid synthase [Rhodocyclales bacterium]
MDTASLNLRWAQALVQGLAAAGAAEVVISPGSRSTPLVLAFLRQPALRTWIVIDERSAAFFALGLAKASGRPAALLGTSGSAPANWFPAVVEAAAGGTPLLLISADRPPELRGWGANQTIDQLKLFGDHVRAAHALGTPEAGVDPGYLHRLAARAVAESRWPAPGPVHLNLPFREPLLPEGEWPAVAARPPVPVAPPQQLPDAAAVARLAAALSGRPGVILCGGAEYPAGFAGAVAALAARLDCPVLGEPLSNLRFGPHDRSRLCVRYEAFLRRHSFTAAHRPEWVLRFGAFPVSRSLQHWLAANAQAAHFLVDPAGRWADPQHAAAALLQADPAQTCRALAAAAPAPAAAAWRRAFAAEEARAATLAAELAAGADPCEEALIPALVARLPAGHRLFCGNSMLIRDVDSFSGSLTKPLRLFGNRGASGIDGNVSTAAGIAAAGPAVALLGDLACVHDLNGLAAARGLDLVLVVLNNGGGGIFGHLPQARLPEFERAWLTPSGIDFAHAAAAWGISHRRVGQPSEFILALDAALAAGGPQVIEVVVDRERSLARHRAYWEAVAAD